MCPSAISADDQPVVVNKHLEFCKALGVDPLQVLDLLETHDLHLLPGTDPRTQPCGRCCWPQDCRDGCKKVEDV